MPKSKNLFILRFIKIFFTRFLFLIIVLNLYSLEAQERISIEFKNGEKIRGFGMLKSNGDIVYSEKYKSKKIVYNYKDPIRRVIVFVGNNKNIYEYKLVGTGEYENYKLLKIEIEGKITLYEEVYQTTMAPGMNGGMMTSYSNASYYISIVGSNRAKYLGIGSTYKKKFREKAREYFPDCLDLIEKIESKSYFKRYGIREVVKYYNINCN